MRKAENRVLLNVYDLSGANDITSFFGIGFYHSGVEVAGEEFSFAKGAGVYSSAPKDVADAKFRESIDMGVFHGSYREARNLAYSLSSDFGPDSYHLISQNCNHFAEAFCQLLLQKSIPGFVNRAAYLGSCCSCLVPDSTDSPVTAPSSTHTAQDKSGPAYTAFAGSGRSLGSSTTSSRSESNGDSVTDRREKMRLAALRRVNAGSSDQT